MVRPSTFSGAAIGATAGGIVGGLVGLGIPEIEARIYEGKLRTGNYLVSVSADTHDEVKRAKEIYEEQKGEDISATGQSTVPKPEGADIRGTTAPALAESNR